MTVSAACSDCVNVLTMSGVLESDADGLEQVIGTDKQCRGKGIQIDVHANLRFAFG
jgi:hypothetical protein